MARRKMPYKPANSAEVVERCDQCGKQLGRTCIRTAGSAACAAGDGVSISHVYANGKQEWRFFCCKECKSAFIAKTE
ncbi:MAG: hypothetical protein WC551_09455 [Patescibacteria group bacterium]|jgi:hypothetical protein